MSLGEIATLYFLVFCLQLHQSSAEHSRESKGSLKTWFSICLVFCLATFHLAFFITVHLCFRSQIVDRSCKGLHRLKTFCPWIIATYRLEITTPPPYLWEVLCFLLQAKPSGLALVEGQWRAHTEWGRKCEPSASMEQVGTEGPSASIARGRCAGIALSQQQFSFKWDVLG